MKTLCIAATLLLVAAAFSFAAGLPVSNVSGNYMEARTADVFTGPCFANGEAEINGKEAVLGWKINNGSWNGVNIAELGVVGCIVRLKSHLDDGFVSHREFPAHGKVHLTKPESRNRIAPEATLCLR